MEELRLYEDDVTVGAAEQYLKSNSYGVSQFQYFGLWVFSVRIMEEESLDFRVDQSGSVFLCNVFLLYEKIKHMNKSLTWNLRCFIWSIWNLVVGGCPR